jgi:hypothetical protein
MIDDLLPYLPQQVSTTVLVLCFIGIGLGWVVWAVGAVWSRGIVTLIGVAVGGGLGMYLPRWYIWPVNSMSTAVLGAVLFGVLAFVIPRLFVGLVLGVLLVLWSSLAMWMLLKGDKPFEFRTEWQVASMTPPEHAADIWQRMPDPVKRVVPYSAATAMISALCITLLWPRAGRMLMASTMGVTLVFGCALVAVVTQKIDWLKYVPMDRQVQGLILLGLVVVGALIQWQFLPGKKHLPVEPVPEEQQSQAP